MLRTERVIYKSEEAIVPLWFECVRCWIIVVKPFFAADMVAWEVVYMGA